MKNRGFSNGKLLINDEEILKNARYINIYSCIGKECKLNRGGENWNNEKPFDNAFELSQFKDKTNQKCYYRFDDEGLEKNSKYYKNLEDNYYYKVEIKFKDEKTLTEIINFELNEIRTSPKCYNCFGTSNKFTSGIKHFITKLMY